MKSTTLANKNFILVVIGQVISLFGNGILRFALPLYLLTITGSSAIFGLVSAVAFLPLILLMPIGGIVADRTNKRNIMVILDFATGLLMLFFYLVMNLVSLIPLLIATLMLLYSISGLYQPTVQASVPLLLDETILSRGNGIVSSISALSNLIAPIIGGLLLASYGIAPIILVSILCFFASALFELLIHIPYEKQATSSSILNMVATDSQLSIQFIFKEKPHLKQLMLVTCLLNAFVSALIMISLPVLITKRLNLSEDFYGFSQAILALGGLFGGITTGVLGKRLMIQKLYFYFHLLALSLLPMLLSALPFMNPSASYILILFGSFMVMSMATVASVTIISYIQSQTMEHMIGKVMAFIMTASMLASPLGQASYGIAFEYLIGYESFIFMFAILLSLLIGFYTKKILFK